MLASSCNMRVEISKSMWSMAASFAAHQGLLPSQIPSVLTEICHQDLPLLYKAIKQDIYDSEERKLSIFVSVLEPDSVCALRILQARPPFCTLKTAFKWRSLDWLDPGETPA